MLRWVAVLVVTTTVSRSVFADDVQALTNEARDMARDGHCGGVADLGRRIAAIDPAFHARVFVTDPSIARCSASTPVNGPTVTWLPFVSLDRQQGHSHLGIEGSFVSLDTSFPSGDEERLDIHGEYTISGPVGVYATIPLGYQSDYGIFARGNLDAGAVVAFPITDEARLVTHAGLTVPTQQVGGDGDPLYGAIGAGSGLARLTDYALSLPINFAARIGISPIVSSGAVQFRGDLGADISLGSGFAIEHNQSAFHVGAGVGTFVDNLGFAGEAVVVVTPWFSEVSVRASLAASVRLRVGPVLPYLSVELPLASSPANPDDGFYTQSASLAVTAGIEYQPD